MSLLTTQELGKSFGPDEIFSGLTLDIPHGARIALVGPNGAGKTTLVNILIGDDLPSEGQVHFARGTRIGFLPQTPELHGDHTLWEEQLTAFSELRQMEAELKDLEHDMAQSEEALQAYGKLQETFELAGGYTYDTRIKMVLQGIGFQESEYHMPLEKLSGGQKTRALLARLLLEEPDLLILDEPTNHLDIDAIEWLEHYLRGVPGAVLAVSHDRYFMDNFAGVIWELEYGTVEVYRGNYSHYLTQRQERHERLLKEYESQQEFLAKEQEYIKKHIAGQNTRQAKGRLKRLETMKKRGKIISKPRGKRREMNLRIQAELRSGDKVLMTEGLAVGYHDSDEPLFEVPDITLYRGETVALIGPNGAGKSTFLKTITEQLPPYFGEVRLGASIQVGYFAQAHELLNHSNTVIDEIIEVKHMVPGDARNYLAQFLFTNEDVFRRISTLSGGERGRVALAKLALQGANVLLLDEPTNHLDIDSQEVLQTVLADFKGTVILVSHDRYLVDALASQIWSVRRGEMQVFEGSYQEYLSERRRQSELLQAAQNEAKQQSSKRSKAANVKPKKNGLNPFELKIRIDEVEAQIHELEHQLEELTEQIASASAAGDSAKVSELGERYQQTEQALEAEMQVWEELHE